MNRKDISYGISFVVLGLVLGFAAANRRAAGSGRAQEDKAVEQVNKNIQVLKGMPASQLLPVMHFMRTSLAVRCDYCHIAENGKYWMDDKPAKQVARQHIQMTFELNRANFGGRTVITCNTCHQGRTKPLSVPPIGQGDFINTTRDDAEAVTPEQLPTAEQIMDRYVAALGGRSAIEKIKTRVMKVTLLRPKLVNSGTPRAAMINRGETWSVEIYQKAPDKYLSITRAPDGSVTSQGFNGVAGWIKNSGGQREMTAAERERIKLQTNLYRDLNFREQYTKLTVTGKEKVGGREAYLIEAQRSADGRREQLFFDTETGLLLRRIVFTETVLGPNPEQTDFEDYRELGGVKLPFTVRVSYLDDNHYGTTRTFVDVKQNVPVDDKRFDAPAIPE